MLKVILVSAGLALSLSSNAAPVNITGYGEGMLSNIIDADSDWGDYVELGSPIISRLGYQSNQNDVNPDTNIGDYQYDPVEPDDWYDEQIGSSIDYEHKTASGGLGGSLMGTYKSSILIENDIAGVDRILFGWEQSIDFYYWVTITDITGTLFTNDMLPKDLFIEANESISIEGIFKRAAGGYEFDFTLNSFEFSSPLPPPPVAEVPLPSSLILFGSAFFALFATMRRGRRSL